LIYKNLLKKYEVKMKSIYAKKIGAIAAGAIMVGAALSGAVSAAFDDTGLDKGFFYDVNYNPTPVQVVVGEKGMATDAVAAGNIAATVGNLAYASAATDVTLTPEGKVVLGVSAMGATGKYIQDTENSALVETFYDDDYDEDYNHFEGDTTYERGDFISYSLACDQQTRSDAGLLMKGTYNNIHCLFCQTLCLDQIENPAHEMEEKIRIDCPDYEEMWYYEDGVGEDDAEELKMAIPKDCIEYIVDTECIPTKRIGTETSPSGDEIIDFEWRGKIIFFGEEYYVRDIKGDDKVYIAKGKVLDDVSSEGYTSEYLGYKFKIDHLIYSEEYQVAGILLDVEKPDGTVVQVQISKQANGIVDDIEIAGVYAEEADALATASIIVYDATTNILLEDGEDLERGGETWDDWDVDLSVVATVDDGDCDLDEYEDIVGSENLLEQYTVAYEHALDDDEALEVDEYLEFPKTFKLIFMGFRTNDFQEIVCSGEGEGNIVVEEGDLEYSLELSFTGDDGNRYNNIRLDEGPYSKGDLVLVDGEVWELYDAEESDDHSETEITFDNIMFGGKERVVLDQMSEEASVITLVTVPRVDAMEDDDPGEYENAEEIEVDPSDGDVYASGDTFQTLDLLFDDGELYFMQDLATDTTLQVDCDMVGDFNDFELNGNDLTMSCEEETGTDLNDESTARSNSPDTDDILVLFENEDGEILVVDFYDIDYNENEDYEYDNSVVALTTWNDSGNAAIVKIDDDNDEVLITPQGGDYLTVDWGSDRLVEAAELCHPQEEVDATYFIGTDETATVMETTITKEDEGASKTAGCCQFTVEEFSVTAGEEAGVTETTVNPITGNLVVGESDADLTKNLVVVGGPAVNGLCTVTSEEIGAASKKYIVKKDGNRLIVAGYEAEDTIAAGDELVEWLNDNIH
jgi:hypothetical protein